jgi:hypothetical protein
LIAPSHSVTLNKLPYSDGASYISDKSCLPGTRTALIDGMLAWIKSANRMKRAEIYYISGAAGVGKTTIGHTVAQRCEEGGLLTSSFFFDGRVAGRNSPAMLFSTIARNLADRNIVFRQEIVRALEERRSLAGATIHDHFRELILRPSRSLRDDNPVVIIIDALDEGHPHEIEHVLKVLRDEVPKLPGTFRVLLSARNTPDLDFYLSDQPHVRRLSIDTSKQANLDDIAIYSQHKLQDIALWTPVVPTVPVKLGWVENYVPGLSRHQFNELPTCSINARQFNAFVNLRSSGYVRSPLPDTVNTHVRTQNASAPSLISHAPANMLLTCPPHPALELVVPHSELDISLKSHQKNHQNYIYISEGE